MVLEFSQIKESYEDFMLELMVSSDKQVAYLQVLMDDQNSSIDMSKVCSFLDKNGIKNYDEDKLLKYIELNDFSINIKVAEGIPPQKGEDGYITYFVNVNDKKKPDIDAKGNIDFKELNLIENVESGKLLAEKTPAIEGVAGIDVFGNSIEPPKVLDPILKVGKNTQVSEDGLKIYSIACGKVDFEDSVININKIHEIKGGVDSATGNIRFNGDVVINGDIKEGFLVEAEGDIFVKGVIEGAIVKAEGSLTVIGGIQGSEKLKINVKKDLTCKYIENATRLFVEGNITTDFIIHSEIYCGASVFLKGKKGMVVGGTMKVKSLLNATTIGSYMGTKTNIEVGMDPRLSMQLEAYQDEKEKIETLLRDLGRGINSLKQLFQRNALNDQKKELFKRSINTYNHNLEKLNLINDQISELNKDIGDKSLSGTIIATDKVFPGVKISMGTYVKFIRSEYAAVRFEVEEGDIATKGI